jgi:hypothetical protein
MFGARSQAGPNVRKVQVWLGISRKRMSVLAMVPFNVVTAMSTTCSDLGRS